MAVLGKILIFVFCCSLQATAQKYTISNEAGNPSSARRLCRLATPNIIYDKDGHSVKLSAIDVEGNFESEEKLWIGYAQIYASFLYIAFEWDPFIVGCSDLDSLPMNRNYSNMPADPGQCYSKCSAPFVGIEENRCYCLPQVPVAILNRGKCDKKCSFSDHTLCGKNNKGVSLYKKGKKIFKVLIENAILAPVAFICNEPEPFEQHWYEWCLCEYPFSLKAPVTYEHDNPGENNPTKACRAVDQKVYTWEKCSDKLRLICQDRPYNDTKRYKYSEDKEKWDNRMKYCLKQNWYPADEHPDTMIGEEKTWIGRIRSFTIVTVIDTFEKEPNFQQGYLQVENGKIELKFESAAKELRGLCDILPVTTPKATIQTTQESTTTVLTARKTTTVKSFNEGDNLHRKSDNPSLVAVYVVVPIPIILIAVLVAFLLWRRRINDTTKATENLGQEKHRHIVDNGVTNSSYNKTSVPDSGSNHEIDHDYFVLEDTDEYAVIKDTEVDQSVEEDYDTTNDSHTGANGQAADTGNVYNTLETVGEETYNHTSDNDTRFDDTYNHVEGEEAYNTVGQDVTDGMTACDDTYNHAGNTY